MNSKVAGAGSFSGFGSAGKNRIDGLFNFPGGTYEDLVVDGVCTSEGPLEAHSIKIDGVFKAKSDVKADILDCDGVVTIEGNLRAGKVDVDGTVSVKGDKVEADVIKCDGILTAENQVSADIIEANGFINAREIVGDRIVIKSFKKSFFFKVFLKAREAFIHSDYSKVDLIEATTIELRGVKAKTVSGHDVIIGPACIIQKVDCSGNLSIDSTATVGVVVGNAEAQNQ